MRLVNIEQNENGSHSNQTSTLKKVPKGWALIPDDMPTPNFPFGDIEVEEIDGIMTVTKWVPREILETTETEKPISDVEQLRADVDYIAIMTGVDL